MKFCRLTLLIILFIETYNCYAGISSANKLKGRVTDSINEPLEFVNVSINVFNMTSVTDKNGYYEFSNIPEGKYLITLKLTGYETKTAIIELTRKDDSFDFVLLESLIETPTIEVTASFTPMNIFETPLSVTSLEGRKLMKEKSQNLARTIANVPGINNISTGNDIGKPVIRGLSSQAVITVTNGVKQESQQWGDEHGPEISLFDVDRIEIIRGPVSLIYGSNGIGGVINVISQPLHYSIKNKPVYYGELNLGGFSVNKEGFANLTFGVGGKSIGIKGNYGYRLSGNIRTPDGEFQINTLTGTKTISGGELFNSGSKESGGRINFGYNGKIGNINASFLTSLRDLEIHEDPQENSDATSNQKVVTSQYEIDALFNINKRIKLEPIFSYQTNSRKEFNSKEDKDKDIATVNLYLKTFDGNLKLGHQLFSNVFGTFGGAFTYQVNSTLGHEKLIPDYSSVNFGAYLLEKVQLKHFTISVGGRFDTKALNIDRTLFEADSQNNTIKLVDAQKLNFNALSGSLGVVYKAGSVLDLFANFGRGWRPPSEFELFVNGVHEGAGRYERGIRTIDPNVSPKPEVSLNIDFGIRVKHKKVNTELTIYRNLINNFIYPLPTGMNFIETDPVTNDTIRIPIYDIKQAQSELIGYEYNIQYQPVNWVLLSVSGDYVRTKNKFTGNPLPFTPPAKNIFEIKFQKNKIGKFSNVYASIEAKIVSPQNNVDPLETKTKGYSLFGASVGFDVVLFKSITSINFSADNLLNTKYVDHLSRLKSYALNPGRSFNLQVSVPFKF